MKKIIPYLKNATALPDYQLLVAFEDGVSGVVNLQKWKGKGVFEYWNEENNFRQFNITNDRKLVWNDDIDMDPDAFYVELTGKTFEAYAGNQQVLRDSY